MKILLVSGFLGAGKTTFIKNLANKINLEFIVLENEYADVGIDGDFLSEKNLNIWEMSEGCICCSMKGDFKNSVLRIYNEINPEYLVIEPTGVGMLSSIIKNIEDIGNDEINILNPLTLIDVEYFDEYLSEFKDFFIDNIKNTGKILLTRINNISINKLLEIKKKILEISSSVDIEMEDYRNFGKNWYGTILNTNKENKIIDSKFTLASHINLKTFSQEDIKINDMDRFGIFLDKLINGDFGKIYRAKGILKIEDQWGKFNLVYKNFEMEAIENVSKTKITIIGNNLNIEKIKEFLN